MIRRTSFFSTNLYLLTQTTMNTLSTFVTSFSTFPNPSTRSARILRARASFPVLLAAHRGGAVSKLGIARALRVHPNTVTFWTARAASLAAAEGAIARAQQIEAGYSTALALKIAVGSA